MRSLSLSTRFFAAIPLSLLALVAACVAPESATPPPAANVPDTTAAITAVANLAPSSGANVQGTLTLTEEAGGVRITGEFTGLTPGDHGIHLHENGDCSAPDAGSAGPHYNPTSMQHGGPDAEQHHAGDLGNITADGNGNARLDRVFTGLTLTGANSIVGRAVIVHASRDDLTSQPAGASGARVACGVIARR